MIREGLPSILFSYCLCAAFKGSLKPEGGMRLCNTRCVAVAAVQSVGLTYSKTSSVLINCCDDSLDDSLR